MSGPLHRRLLALEAARQTAEAPDYAATAREVFDSAWRGWPTTPSENAAGMLALAERLEVGDLEGLPPAVRADPGRAARIARAAAQLLTH